MDLGARAGPMTAGEVARPGAKGSSQDLTPGQEGPSPIGGSLVPEQEGGWRIEYPQPRSETPLKSRLGPYLLVGPTQASRPLTLPAVGIEHETDTDGQGRGDSENGKDHNHDCPLLVLVRR